jgi:hypothetical protein
MTTYAKRKLKYSRKENFNLLHYLECTLTGALVVKRTEGYVIVSRWKVVMQTANSVKHCFNVADR